MHSCNLILSTDVSNFHCICFLVENKHTFYYACGFACLRLKVYVRQTYNLQFEKKLPTIVLQQKKVMKTINKHPKYLHPLTHQQTHKNKNQKNKKNNKIARYTCFM